jgi:hypothetical protein
MKMRGYPKAKNRLRAISPKGRSPMAKFLLDCCFNGIYKGRKNGVLIHRYAKSTLHYAKFFQKILMPTPVQLSVKNKPKFSGRLSAIRHSAESTHICKYLCEIETKFKNILG